MPFAQAQTYQSVFGQTSATWNFFYELPDEGVNDKNVTTGDTIINSVEYKKLFSYAQLGNVSLLFLREDSNHSRLYVYDSQLDSDRILMDLNGEVGDTIHYALNNDVIIDSIYNYNGAKHIRSSTFLFDWPIEYARLEYIEGVGPTCGFNSYHDGTLLCHSRDSIQNFQFPDTAYSCDYYWLGIAKLQTERKLQLFPNPFSDFLSLTSPFQSSSLLSVMNSQGQIILKKRLQPFEKISLTKNELPTQGLILFQLISDEGVSQSAIAIHGY